MSLINTAHNTHSWHWYLVWHTALQSNQSVMWRYWQYQGHGNRLHSCTMGMGRQIAQFWGQWILLVKPTFLCSCKRCFPTFLHTTWYSHVMLVPLSRL